jgi:DNA polymerase-3 subunit delta
LPKPLLDAVKKAGGIVVDTNVGTGRKDRAAFVDEQVAGSGLKLDEPARRAVTDHLGEDLGRLASLLDTLGATFGPGAKLGLADVEPFLGAAGSVPPWDLTDAIDRGDTARALDALRRMTAAGGRHPLQIMAVLHGHYGRILRLEGGPAHDRSAAAALLGGRTSPFQADKALQQAKRLGHPGVTRAIHLLADADLDLRGAKDWPEALVMEVLVARLSRLAPPARR